MLITDYILHICNFNINSINRMRLDAVENIRRNRFEFHQLIGLPDQNDNTLPMSGMFLNDKRGDLKFLKESVILYFLSTFLT